MSTLFDVFGLTRDGQPINVPLASLAKLGTGSNVKIDKNFVHDPEYVKKFLAARSMNKNLWIWGPAGTGKTETCQQIAAGLNVPVTVISFGEETSLRDLIGSKVLSQGETPWQDGALTKAMRTPDMLIVLDELNMSNPGVAAQMNNLLQDRKIIIPETGEVVECAEGVFLIATANTSGGSDESGLFAGSQTQNAATRSRFVGLKMTYMDAEHEEAILERKVSGLSKKFPPIESISIASLMVKTGQGIRAAIDDGHLGMAFSVRQLINWGECSLALGNLIEGFKMAYADLLSESEYDIAAEIFKTTTGMSL
jgi:cobaltochelatase CobS